MRRTPLLLSVTMTLCLAPTGCFRSAPPPAPAPPATPKVGGDYGPVTADHLIGAHECFRTGKSADNQFSWTFAKDRFVMQAKDDQTLPDAVAAALLGPEQKAKKIEGNWEFAGRDLKLTKLQADGKDVAATPVLTPFRTPVVRIHFGPDQYVLRKLPK